MVTDIAEIFLLKNQYHHSKVCKKYGILKVYQNQQPNIYQTSNMLDNTETKLVFNII